MSEADWIMLGIVAIGLVGIRFIFKTVGKIILFVCICALAYYYYYYYFYQAYI